MKKITKVLATAALLGAVSVGAFGAVSAPVAEVDAATTVKASTGTLVIKKLDNNNRPVAGTVFKILTSTGQYVKQVVTNSQGVATTTLSAPVSYNIVDVAAAGTKGSVMYYVPVQASATKTVLFNKAFRESNTID